MTEAKDITILYVDDEQPNLQLFELMFNEQYQVLTASSGQEGLEVLKFAHNKIIVVVSDMRMPGMNGVEFIKAAKKEYNGNIAYFILTGFGRNPEIEAAIESKLIERFFLKPFDVDEMRQEIEAWYLKRGA